ncbi:MAG: DUF4124 domain-containing protein [Neisseria sp.]|nr:DUF4124 domain-containing protein [Neisseria sp.]
MKAAFTLLLLTTALPALAAPVYECTDKNGRRTYTQDPRGNCQTSKLGKPSIYSAAPVYQTSAAAPADNGNQASANTAELASAQQQLEQARTNLEEGRKVRYGNERNYVRYQERIAGLEQAVAEAQQKLDAVQQGGAAGIQ